MDGWQKCGHDRAIERRATGRRAVSPSPPDARGARGFLPSVHAVITRSRSRPLSRGKWARPSVNTTHTAAEPGRSATQRSPDGRMAKRWARPGDRAAGDRAASPPDARGARGFLPSVHAVITRSGSRPLSRGKWALLSVDTTQTAAGPDRSATQRSPDGRMAKMWARPGDEPRATA